MSRFIRSRWMLAAIFAFAVACGGLAVLSRLAGHPKAAPWSEQLKTAQSIAKVIDAEATLFRVHATPDQARSDGPIDQLRVHFDFVQQSGDIFSVFLVDTDLRFSSRRETYRGRLRPLPTVQERQALHQSLNLVRLSAADVLHLTKQDRQDLFSSKVEELGEVSVFDVDVFLQMGNQTQEKYGEPAIWLVLYTAGNLGNMQQSSIILSAASGKFLERTVTAVP